MKRQESEKLTAEERALVEGSRRAIVAAGISPAYFDEHFSLLKVINKTGDRRIVWRLKVDEYETFLNDAIGFYTDERGERVYTHSIANALGSARDVTKVIPRASAERIMRECIGEYESASVHYQSFGATRRAALLFSAVSLPPAETETTQKTQAVTSASQPQQQPPPSPVAEGSQASDYIKPGGKKKPFLIVGTINLETGECVKGVAQVGSPVPQPPTK